MAYCMRPLGFRVKAPDIFGGLRTRFSQFILYVVEVRLGLLPLNFLGYAMLEIFSDEPAPLSFSRVLWLMNECSQFKF